MTRTSLRRRRGEPVVWRSLPFGEVGYALPATVVRDDEDAIAIFQPRGTVCKRRTGDGFVDRVWTDLGTLRLHVVGTDFSVIRAWDADGQRFQGWYINLEASWRRTSMGFDSHDYVLDITVADDMSSWSWKDEASYGRARDSGRIDGDTHIRVHRAARLAITALERREWPFQLDWERWCPDGGWALPRLPEGWARLAD